MDYVKCFCLIVAYLAVYYSFGSIAARLARVKQVSPGWTLVVGMLFYYALLYVFYLPSMFTLRSLGFLTRVWLPVVALICMVSILLNGKTWISDLKRALPLVKIQWIWIGLIVVIIGVQFYLIAVSMYNDYDSMFYVGTANTSVYTNTMYRYDSYTGAPASHLELRYALSSFTMNSAMFSKLLNLHPILEMKVCMGIVGCLLANVMYGLLAKELLIKKSVKNIALVLGVAFWINIFFNTTYSTSSFLVFRTYEGKAFCANVLLPAVVYLGIKIYQGLDLKYYALSMLLLTTASNSITMSSMLTVPVAVTAAMVPVIVKQKGVKVSQLATYGIWMIPSVCVLLTYFLYTKGMLNIGAWR